MAVTPLQGEIVIVQDPSDVSEFIRFFKTESAHMLNRVLGRKKRTIWCEGYDSPVILDEIRALIAMSYLYANPAKDNLEESIDKYPGLNSWNMFISGKTSESWKRIRRPAFRKLELSEHNLAGYTKESLRIAADAKKSYPFILKPNAWIAAFGITDPEEQAKLNERLIARVRHLEERAKTKRERERKNVMGAQRLLTQRLDLTYRPNRSGKRMNCLSVYKDLRIDFIDMLKDLYSKGKEVLKNWKNGDYSVPYPLGLYPPSMPKLGELLELKGLPSFA